MPKKSTWEFAWLDGGKGVLDAATQMEAICAAVRLGRRQGRAPDANSFVRIGKKQMTVCATDANKSCHAKLLGKT